MVTFIVIAVVSGSLVLGAAWGIYGNLPDRVEGLIVALAGGALMISAVLELIEPASHVAPFWAVSALVLAGAAIFAALDHLIKERGGGDSGGGLLAATAALLTAAAPRPHPQLRRRRRRRLLGHRGLPQGL